MLVLRFNALRGRRLWLAAAGMALLLAACGAVVTVVGRDRATAGPSVRVSVGPTGTSPAPTSQALASAAPTSGAPTSSSPTRAPQPPPRRFGTLSVGASLPSGAQCAEWVRREPIAESKAANARINAKTGHRLTGELFTGSDPRAEEHIAQRIDGQFTGTTGEILRWAACKWGIDEGVARAQAAMESWWRQATRGDWGTDPEGCAPGHGLGADGTPGQCPASYGIMQVKYEHYAAGWPGLAESTAMNADLAYGVWRACFEGYETWLNDVERGRQYASGDLWGCVGRWFSGRWHLPDGERYVAQVQEYLAESVWLDPDFAES